MDKFDRRYYVYCDESIKKGKYYSNFYGGALINSKDHGIITDVLNEKKNILLQTREIKWQKINKQNYKEYIDAVDTFLDFVQSGKVKIRIMFRQNRFKPVGLTNDQKRNEYFLLYYQFLKHAFGFRFLDSSRINHLEIFLDNIPDKKEKKQKFIDYLNGIQHLPEFLDSNIKISRQQISEVDSENHVIMQLLDVVLGAMAFKLNKRDRIKLDTGRRGKKTVVKDKVYKNISKRIRMLYPNFNIGITTGVKDNFANVLEMPYRHWSFQPKNHELD